MGSGWLLCVIHLECLRLAYVGFDQSMAIYKIGWWWWKINTCNLTTSKFVIDIIPKTKDNYSFFFILISRNICSFGNHTKTMIKHYDSPQLKCPELHTSVCTRRPLWGHDHRHSLQRTTDSLSKMHPLVRFSTKMVSK